MTATAPPDTTTETEAGENIFAGLDALPGHDTPEAATRANEAKPADPAPAKVAEPAAKVDSEPAKVEPKPAEAKESKESRLGEDLDGLVKKPEPASELKTPKELREAYARTKTELEKREARIKELESGSDSVKKSAAEEARKALEVELKELREAREQAEEQLRLTDYTKSSEFREKYAAPIQKAVQGIEELVKGIKVADGDNERDATAQDVMNLLRMTDIQANRAARATFGDDAPVIMDYRKRLLDLADARDAAVAEYKTKGKSLTEQSAAARKAHLDRWEQSVKEIQTEHSGLFGTVEGDTELNDLVTKGNSLVRMALVGDNLPGDMKPEERSARVLQAQALVAARAAGFGRQVLVNNRLKAEIEALQTKLKKFENLEPDPGGERGGGETPKVHKDIVDGIDDIPGRVFPS